MTCRGDGSTGSTIANWRFENWSRTRAHVVRVRHQPTNVRQLVAAVQAGESAGGVVKAIGSGWSYPDTAIAAEVTHAIDTEKLTAVLSGTNPASASTLLPFALNDAARARARYFVHVEAGIKVHALNCVLDGSWTWEQLEANPIDGAPAAVSWGPDRIDVFVRGTDGALYQKFWNGTAWSGYVPLGGVLNASPAACSWAPGRLDVFGRGTDNALHQQTWTGSQWTGWRGLDPTPVTSEPTAVSWGPNRIDVFVRGSDNSLLHKWWDGVRWNGYESLGGVLTSGPAGCSRGPGLLDIFARGTDQALWHMRYENGFKGWEQRGATPIASSPAAVASGRDRIDVMVRGADGALQHKWWNGAEWSDYESRGGVLTSGPAVCSWGPGRLDAFARGTDNALWHDSAPVHSLAMATLGGSNGQSIAGAISTGTHGSDVDLPPIADRVRAIHLVGPGGQEWWIERSGARAITDPTRLEQARDAGRLCSDIRIEYNDGLFNAALVSVGRMGVIYSYVVEATDAFRLKQTRQKQAWSAASSFIRTQIRDAVPYAGDQFVEIVVNPYKNATGDRDAIVTRKNRTTEPLSAEGASNEDNFDILCNKTPVNDILGQAAVLLPPMIAAAATAAEAGATLTNLIPIVGPFIFAATSAATITAATTALVALEELIRQVMNLPGEDLAQKLASILNSMTNLGQKQLVPELTSVLLTTVRNPDEPPKVQKNFRMLTGQLACGQPWQPIATCKRQIDGLEFALDLRRGSERLFGFVDDVFALTDEFYTADMPAAFGLSLRFTKGTEALIGMQQFARTCSVEFIMLRGLKGQEDFLRRLYAIAKTHNAIPHWGLIHEIDAAEVARLYDTRLRDWRAALGRVIEGSGGRADTFRTSYSTTRGLEPIYGGLVISSSARIPILIWDPTPQPQGSLTSTSLLLFNRSSRTVQVTDVRITTSQDAPGAPVFRVLPPRPFAVTAGQLLYVPVEFAPTQPGTITGSVTVVSDDPLSPVTARLSTSATPLGRHAELQVTPSVLDFGSVRVGATSSRSLTVTNIGAAPHAAVIESIAATAGEAPAPFTAQNVGSVAAGASVPVDVVFRPTNRGPVQATLAIDMRSATDAGPNAIYRRRYTVALNGSAQMPTIVLAGARRPVPPAPPDAALDVLDFGAAAPGTTVTRSLWIRNDGDLPLLVRDITPSGSFGVPNLAVLPATVPAGGEFEVPCIFLAAPVAGTPSRGTFTVRSDDPLRPEVVLNARGAATGPHLSDPLELLDLGAGNPPSQGTVTFRSDGTDSVTLRRLVLTPAGGSDFAMTASPTVPARLLPGSPLTVTIRCTSTQPGQRTAQIVLDHDGKPSGNSQVLLRAIIDPDGPTPLQSEWRWCSKCQGLFFGPSVAISICPAGGAHATPAESGSSNYSLPHSVAVSGAMQSDWRWCNKCQGLFFGSSVANSRCPAGGTHAPAAQSGSADYNLPHNAPAAGRQSEWRWCNRCQGLFYGPSFAASRCPAGGTHASAAQSGSGDYSLPFAPNVARITRPLR
jgi:hypothetical protein